MSNRPQIAKGDKVVVFRGAARHLRDEKGQPLVGTVLQVDPHARMALVEMPRPKGRPRGERETPLRGVECWKTVRYNPNTGERGGLKIIKRPVHLANLKLVGKGPAREFSRNR